MMSVLVELLLTVRSAVRPRAALLIEVHALRHQLRVLEWSGSDDVLLTWVPVP